MHHDHVLGELQRLLLVVGDQHRGQLRLLVQPSQPGAQLDSYARVERPERLIQQQHAGPGRQGARERHPLPLAAGKLRRLPAPVIAQLHQVEQLVHALADLARGQPPHAQPKGDVLVDGQVLEERMTLEDESHLALLDRHPCALPAVEEYPACVRDLQTGNEAQQRGLSGARRAEQRGDRAGRRREGYFADGGSAGELLAQPLHAHAHGRTSRARRASSFFAASVTSARSDNMEATANAPAKSYSS